MGKKTILMISQNFYPEIGSAGNRMKNMYLLLKRSGYEVTVVTSEPSYPNRQLYKDDKFWDEEDFNTIHHPSIHRVKTSGHKYPFSFISRLLHYVLISLKILNHVMRDKGKYDFVLATSPPIFIGMVGLAARLRFRSRLILDIRDLWPESLRGVGVFNRSIIIWLFKFVEKTLYRKADHIVVNSRGFIKYIQAVSAPPPSKISFLPNGLRQSELNKERETVEEFKVIYSGNIGLAQDVEILKGLTKKLGTLGIKISIAGYGVKKDELADFVDKEALTNVQFINPLTREECMKVNSEHQAGFVSLSDKEVFETVLPGKVIDYIGCNVPIVAAVSGYAKDFIEEHKVGFVSGSRDLDEMLKYIVILKENPAIRKRLADNCARCTKENFLWERNIQTIRDILESEDVQIPKRKVWSH